MSWSAFKERLSVKKLYDDLDYWIMIGIGDDIVTVAEQRQEYQRLVNQVYSIFDEVTEDEVPELCLKLLSYQLERPFYLRQDFYYLLWLEIKRVFS